MIASEASLADLYQAIEKAGYKQLKETAKSKEEAILNLKVIGMDNPHCLSTVDGALNSLQGIIRKELFVNQRAKIQALMSP